VKHLICRALTCPDAIVARLHRTSAQLGIYSKVAWIVFAWTSLQAPWHYDTHSCMCICTWEASRCILKHTARALQCRGQKMHTIDRRHRSAPQPCCSCLFWLRPLARQPVRSLSSSKTAIHGPDDKCDFLRLRAAHVAEPGLPSDQLTGNCCAQRHQVSLQQRAMASAPAKAGSGVLVFRGRGRGLRPVGRSHGGRARQGLV
jgi:hypothetical protein